MSHISPQGEQSTATEIEALANLVALATSGAGQAIRKTGDTTFANVDLSSGTTVAWGNVTGTLSDQTDLQAALDAKAGTLSGTANQIAYFDTTSTISSLATGTYPSLTELSYVKGVTSAIQTQINAKAPSTSPTFATSITGSYLTASEILGTDGSKNIVSLAVATYPSLTELAYVKGVTSAIQTQMSGKASTALSNLASVAINTTLVSDTDNTDALGTAAIGWSDLFLGNGAVITFSTAPSTADITLTHSSNQLTLEGGDMLIRTDGTWSAGDVANLYLGDTSTYIRNTFGTGVGINASGSLTLTSQFSNDITLTPDSGLVTVNGGLSVGTSNAVTVGTIELGAASDTTLARIAAGRVSIEGVEISTASNTLTLTNKTLTSPTLTTPSAFTTGGTITLAENTSIALDPAGSADEKWSGITVAGTAGATIAVGDLIYLDVTATEWLLADASAASTAGSVILGLCVSASTDGNATVVLLQGTIRSAAFPGSIALGAPLYVSETAGDITATAPTTTDAVIRVVGWAVTAEPNTIYFNPDPGWITHT